jgi:membrane protein DedA with SNARE-associated domain
VATNVTAMKRYWKKIPKLPFSALLFYLTVVVLWNLRIIPSPSEIVLYLEQLYLRYGYLGLFIATFFESIAYLGLYIPGSFIIALTVFFSDKTFPTLLTITVIVTVTLTITAVINYLIGRFIATDTKVDIKKLEKAEFINTGLFVSMLHPNLLSFYFFNAGLEQHNFKKIIIVPIFILPYGYLIAYLLARFSVAVKQRLESPSFLFSLILLWLVIAFVVNHRKKPKVQHL